jgi:hypothetical protein
LRPSFHPAYRRNAASQFRDYFALFRVQFPAEFLLLICAFLRKSAAKFMRQPWREHN